MFLNFKNIHNTFKNNNLIIQNTKYYNFCNYYYINLIRGGLPVASLRANHLGSLPWSMSIAQQSSRLTSPQTASSIINQPISPSKSNPPHPSPSHQSLGPHFNHPKWTDPLLFSLKMHFSIDFESPLDPFLLILCPNHYVFHCFWLGSKFAPNKNAKKWGFLVRKPHFMKSSGVNLLFY